MVSKKQNALYLWGLGKYSNTDHVQFQKAFGLFFFLNIIKMSLPVTLEAQVEDFIQRLKRR